MQDIYVKVKTKEQLECVVKANLAGTLIISPACFRDAKASLSGSEQNLFLALPETLRQKDAAKAALLVDAFLAFCRKEPLSTQEGVRFRKRGFYLQNPDAAGLLLKKGFTGPVIAGEFLYSCNSAAISFYRDLFSSIEFQAPCELTFGELAETEKRCGVRFLYKVYGYQILMVTAQCFFKLQGRCRKGANGVFPFTDRKRETFYAAADCENCCNLVYNSVPVCMFDKQEEMTGKRLFLDFTIEDAAEVSAALKAFRESSGFPQTKRHFTRGHYYKKID